MPFIICCIIGAGLGALVGLKAKRYYVRLKFFEEWSTFLEKLSINLNFFQDELPNVVKNNNSTKFGIVITYYKEYLNSGDHNTFIDRIKSISFLNGEEQEKIAHFFSELGRSDVPTQKALFSSYKTYLKGVIEGCLGEVNKKATLIQKLSVILGLVVVIILL